jgi:hypothetical protein
VSWRFEQDTGLLFDEFGKVAGKGYSGKGEGVNNPALQNVGPIPVGGWTIGPPFFSEKHGPYCLSLSPNTWQTRWGFLIHGDSIAHPGQASEGCIILTREVRMKVWNSGDHQLEVFVEIPVEVA